MSEQLGVEGEDEQDEEEQDGGEWEEEENIEESRFVEIGYISSVHGLQGEVRVKSSTAFPELRFGEVFLLSFRKICVFFFCIYLFDCDSSAARSKMAENASIRERRNSPSGAQFWKKPFWSGFLDSQL